MLPDLRSSAQSRMLSAGTRNKNSHGWNVKKAVRSAWPRS